MRIRFRRPHHIAILQERRAADGNARARRDAGIDRDQIAVAVAKRHFGFAGDVLIVDHEHIGFRTVIDDARLRHREQVAGRLEGGILFPEDPLLSPRHATFTFSGNSLQVADENSLNGVYMRQMPSEELLDTLVRTLPYLPAGQAMLDKLDEAKRAQLLAAMPGLKERAKTLVELLKGAAFLYAARPLPLDDKAKQILADGGHAALAGLTPVLSGAAGWTAAELEAAVKAHAEAAGLKLGKLAQPLRAALTGTSTSPGIFDVLEVLGREESLARIADATKD